MKKLLRIFIGGLCIAAGAAGIILTIYLFTRGADIITGVIYVAMAAVGLSVAGLGWVIATGGSVKEVLQDVISGISL